MALSVLQNGRFAGASDNQINNGAGGVERCAQLSTVNRECDRLTIAAIENAGNLTLTAKPAGRARAVRFARSSVK